jgi:hypothetical protein
MTNKKNPNRRTSIQVSINAENFDDVWKILEECDKAGIDRSTEIWRMVLAAEKNEELQAELKRHYPDEFMTDAELARKVRQLPPSWNLWSGFNFDKALEAGIMLTLTTIEIEQDMSKRDFWRIFEERSSNEEPIQELDVVVEKS